MFDRLFATQPPTSSSLSNRSRARRYPPPGLLDEFCPAPGSEGPSDVGNLGAPALSDLPVRQAFVMQVERGARAKRQRLQAILGATIQLQRQEVCLTG